MKPCIDYRGLHKLIVKYPYPRPLVPMALEQLCSARIFTKLDLCSIYNLICIRAGEKWKTALRTTSGHYQYWSCRKVRLLKFVIAYIDNILMKEHNGHVWEVIQRLWGFQERNVNFIKRFSSFLDTSSLMKE